MNRSVRRLATRFFAVTTVSSLLASNAVASQGWYNSYEEALAAAKREGKPIFADFSTTWCHNCRQLERETLSDPNIEARLDNFVKVHIDGEQRADIAQQFQIDAYPTMITLDPAGRMVDKNIGFVRANELAGTLDNQMQRLAPTLQQMHAQAAAEKTPADKGHDKSKADKLKGKDLFADSAGAAAQTAAAGKGKAAAGAKPMELSPLDGKSPAIASGKNARGSDAVASVYDLQNNTSTSPNTYAGGNARTVAAAPAVAPKMEDLPLSQAEAKYRAQQANRNVYASGAQPRNPAADSRNTASVQTGSAQTGTNEIAPLLGSGRGVADNLPRHNGSQMVLTQATTRSTPASATDASASDEELPKPLLQRGASHTPEALDTKPALNTSKPAASAKTASTKSTEQAETAAKSETTGKTETSAKSTTAKSAGSSDDAMSTIRKLQGSTKTKSTTVKTDEAAAAKSTALEKSEPAAASAKSETSAKSGTAKSAAGKETVTEETASKQEVASAPADAPKATTSGEEAGAAKSGEVTADDVNRWIKDADSKLVAGRKKEARAMYQKVYEKDPQNQFGKSDMAFIKMVSLMVDQDDDAKRQQAFNKIKEFEALFPDSEHKDYYTLIRATLAADLGDTNAAHKLLEEFPNRFPDSKYKELAYNTWKSLPPVSKSSTSKQVASKETPTKKSSDKKKKTED